MREGDATVVKILLVLLVVVVAAAAAVPTSGSWGDVSLITVAAVAVDTEVVAAPTPAIVVSAIGERSRASLGRNVGNGVAAFQIAEDIGSWVCSSVGSGVGSGVGGIVGDTVGDLVGLLVGDVTAAVAAARAGTVAGVGGIVGDTIGDLVGLLVEEVAAARAVTVSAAADSDDVNDDDSSLDLSDWSVVGCVVGSTEVFVVGALGGVVI